MATTARSALRPAHPLHAALLAGAVPLFLGTLLADWAYARTYQVQWANFASWLVAGALVLTGLALLWSLIDLVRFGRRRLLHVLLLLATFLIGFVNALVHARDAWAAMPAGLILSVIVLLLALAAAWTLFSADRRRPA